jgi:hypothetical protein
MHYPGLRFRVTYKTVKAVITWAQESTSKAGIMLCVRSRMTPTAQGLACPARLPMELIHAMPAAAADPERMAVGYAQKTAN